MRNMRIWNCNYGHGKKVPTFFSIFPLQNAPYTAAYEEQEVFCAMHDYLRHAKGVEILPSVRLLLSEFIKYIVHRAVYYYPPMLLPDMISHKVKTGEIDPKLWIALEDLNDGWERSGAVGMEVYGAGNAFGILPRHYIRVNDRDFFVFCEYPVSGIRQKTNSVSFTIDGDGFFTCKLALVKQKNKLPAISVTQNKMKVHGRFIRQERKEYVLSGNGRVILSW